MVPFDVSSRARNASTTMFAAASHFGHLPAINLSGFRTSSLAGPPLRLSPREACARASKGGLVPLIPGTTAVAASSFLGSHGNSRAGREHLDAQEVDRQREARGDRYSLEGRRVLIVEDDPLIALEKAMASGS